MTIKDIARESGYAVGTVSRALNNAPGVDAAVFFSSTHYACTSLERVKCSWSSEKTTTNRKKTTALA